MVDGKPKPRVLSLGDGLLLQVAPSTVDAKGDYSTSKQWLYRYSLDGHERRYGLGPFDPANKAGMNLDRARIKAMLLREQVAQGIDPLERKHEQREERERKRLARRTTGKTLQEVAEEFIAMQAPRWSTGVTDQWRDTMKRLVYPFIGKIPVAQVTDEDVLRVLEPLWARNATNTGREICKYLYRIFGYAIARKYRTLANPAVWKNGLEHALAKPRKAEPRPALDYRHMPAFMAKLRQEPGDNARCLEFVILTGVRSNEAREATWGEIDLAERTRTIPKKRMKMRGIIRYP